MLDDAVMTDSAVTTDAPVGASDGATGGTETATETLPAESTESQATETQTESTTTESPVESDLGPAIEGQPVPLPKELRALMADKELSANPVVAAAIKQLQSAYDRLNAYTLHFPTVGDAKKFQEAFPGGLQDAVAAQAKAQEAIDSDNAYYSRDPQQHAELAASWYDDDPEAFPILAQAGMEVLAEKNPEAYRQLGLTVLEQTLGAMMDVASRRNDQEALGRISKVHEDIFGRKPGEQARVDPRDRQLQERTRAQEQREQKFQSQVAATFATESNRVASGRISQSIESVLKVALANVKITPAARNKISEDIHASINSTLLQDKALDNQLKSIAQAGMRSGQFSKEQQDRWVNAIYAKARGLVQSTAQKVINQWTQDFLGMKNADVHKRETAASRTDITGGGTPDLGVKPLSGYDLYKMTDEEIRKLPPNFPKTPNWREEMRRARAQS